MPIAELNRSPVLELAEARLEIFDTPDYTEEEENYIKGLKVRMENARNSRDQSHDEFDGMDYATHYDFNERVANTFIGPKLNKEDSNFKSGTVRSKLFSLLSSLVNLNLGGDISAFDKEGLQVQALGDAMEDIILKTDELDNDEEKKFLRQYELLKHGTVFVEELWDERQFKSKSRVKFDGKIDQTWTTRIKKAFARPTRNIVPAINVYLGDITQYDVSTQPHVFTVDEMPYEEAKVVFGEWDQWRFVPRKLQKQEPLAKSSQTTYGVNWRLLEIQEDRVEVIRYQDKWNNEFAVMLNGVLMTPVGLPLPWGYEDYNIAQQNLEPIHSKFAYGKSLVSRIRNKAALLDEMMKLGVLKTQKSFMPAYTNISGRVLSNRVLMPGKISHGIPPNTLVPINENEASGITNSELAMIKEIQASIDAETVSPTFQGQQAQGSPTATEIIELQRQSRLALGMTMFAVSMLEWKLEWLRLKNLLANWFNEDATDEARGLLRQISTEKVIEGEGNGRRIVIPLRKQDRMPSMEAVMGAEDALTEEQGMPIRLIFLKPSEIKSSKLVWQITIRPREKATTELNKLMFRAFMADASIFGPSLNQQFLQERFASVWNEDPSKLFRGAEEVQAEQQALAQEEQRGETRRPEPTGIPSPEKVLGGKIREGLMAGVGTGI